MYDSRLWITKVYDSSLVVNPMNFQRSISWEPFQTPVPLGLLGFVLAVLNIHSLPKGLVVTDFILMFCIVSQKKKYAVLSLQALAYLSCSCLIFFPAFPKVLSRIFASELTRGTVNSTPHVKFSWYNFLPSKSISFLVSSKGYTNFLPIRSSAGANPVALLGSERTHCRA